MTKASAKEQESYIALTQAHHPKRPILRNVAWAFGVGGAICSVGQVVLNYLVQRALPLDEALALTSTTMVVLGAVLTGVGVYDRLGARAGMGAALPITGFANSMVSPALEFKREGFVLGVSARMFQIAGPVIVYGSLSAIVVAILKIYVFRH